MSRFQRISAIYFSALLLAATCLLSPSAHAVKCAAKEPRPVVQLEEVNLPSQIIHRLYPAVPFFMAKVYLDSQGWKDNGANKFVGYVILASAFHAATDLAKLTSEIAPIVPGSAVQALSSFAMFIPAGLLHGVGSPLAGNFFAAGANQIGQGFKHSINENVEGLRAIAVKMNLTEHHREHINEVARSTGAFLALSTIGYMKSGHDISSLSDRTAASLSFTSAYILREALNEHFKHLGHSVPALSASGLLSFAGALGTIITTPGQMPAIVSEAFLEAGFYTGVESTLSQVPASSKQVATAIIGIMGAFLYTPKAYAVSARLRMQNTLASAMLLPVAFTTLDIAKEYISHLYYK